MLKSWCCALLTGAALALTSLPSAQAQESTDKGYISDDLIIYVHTGPGRQYRIIGSIQAGTPVTVLSKNEESGFTQIIDDTDREGWVESDWVAQGESRKTRLPEALDQLADARRQLGNIDNNNQQLASQVSDLEQTNKALNQQLADQTKALERLQAKVDAQSEEEFRAWFTRGGIVVAGSIFFGMLLTYLPKKRRRNDGWM